MVTNTASFITLCNAHGYFNGANHPYNIQLLAFLLANSGHIPEKLNANHYSQFFQTSGS